MKEYNDFKWLVQHLTSAELKILPKFINLNSDLTLDSQSIVLLKSLIQNSFCEEAEIQLKLYGEQNQLAFRKLVKRTYEKVLDVILLKQSLENNQYYNFRAKEIFILRKELLLFDMLLSRGYSDSSISKLDKLIQKAYKFEYYDILLLALYKKRRLQASVLRKSEFNEITTEISKIEQIRSCFIKAEESFYLICARTVKFINTVTDRQDYLKGAIEEIKANYVDTKSKGIKFYLIYHEIEYFDLSGDYYSAVLKTIELLSFLEHNVSVNSLPRNVSAKLNLAIYYIKCYLFEECISTLRTIDRKIMRNQYNDILLKEVLLNHSIYTVNSSLARECLIYLHEIVDEKTKNIPFFPKYLYYLAAVEYIFKMEFQFRVSYSLKFSSDLPDEKWKFAQRVFQIQLLIEAEKFELADVQIENNRKYMERMKKNDVLSKRQALIGKILADLSRKSYDFRKVWKSRAKEFALLDSAEPEYRWQIMSPELIVFHEWFQSRLRLEVYDHAKVMQRMKEKISPLVQKPLLTLPSNGGRKHNRGVSSGSKREKLASA